MFMYGALDTKFQRRKDEFRKEKISPLSSYQFYLHNFVQGKKKFDLNAVPNQFQATPDTLLVLAARAVDAIPLPTTFKWTNVDVCKWVRQYGYPQYQRTFRENLIHGRTLLLVDAAALSAMNIKNYDDIVHIAYGIRGLYYFEMVKFARSISLPWQYLNGLYKLFRVKSGRKYDLTCRSDLYRKMQIIREFPKNSSHWEILEQWLSLEPDHLLPELFGGFRRKKLFKCKINKPVPPKVIPPVPCKCFPPCECLWEERNYFPPWRMTCLQDDPKWDAQFKLNCEKCMPPCTCSWTSKKFEFNSSIGCLRQTLPEKYGDIQSTGTTMKFAKIDTIIRSSLMK